MEQGNLSVEKIVVMTHLTRKMSSDPKIGTDCSSLEEGSDNGESDLKGRRRFEKGGNGDCGPKRSGR